MSDSATNIGDSARNDAPGVDRASVRTISQKMRLIRGGRSGVEVGSLKVEQDLQIRPTVPGWLHRVIW